MANHVGSGETGRMGSQPKSCKPLSRLSSEESNWTTWRLAQVKVYHKRATASLTQFLHPCLKSCARGRSSHRLNRPSLHRY